MDTSRPAPRVASDSRGSKALVVALLLLFFAGAIFAFAGLWKYKYTPGRPATAPASWPAASRLPREAGLPMLVVFAHPMCACTPATLTELRVLQSREAGRFVPCVAFLMPDAEAPRWLRSREVAIARSIPGVRVFFDTEGSEAARFGVHTSGQTLLYDAAGRLRFSGGITLARGHEGDNPGLTALAASLEGRAARAGSHLVFGCSLDDSCAACPRPVLARAASPGVR